MAVLMTLRVAADGAQIEKLAGQEAGIFSDTIDIAKRHGVISHHFYASDTEVLVVDEWPDEGAFHAFFGEAEAHVRKIMDAAGATAEPDVSFWRPLKVGDEIG